MTTASDENPEPEPTPERPKPPAPLSNRSHAVQEILDALMKDLEPPYWMTPELLHALEGACEAHRSHVLMHKLRTGMITHEEAQKTVPLETMVGIFDFGFQAGLKLANDNEFRRMMGEEEV